MPTNPSISEKLQVRLEWADLDQNYLRKLVEMARDEDLSGAGLATKPSRTGDCSTATLKAVPRSGRAHIVAREDLVACGLPLLPLILSAYGPGVVVKNQLQDGTKAKRNTRIATLEGDSRVLLTAERVILNFLQNLSGVATTTARYVAVLGPGRTRLLDTRKTTPGYRTLEKYAVARGGAWNHRLGLFDRVMLKDNHLALTGDRGGLAEAVSRAKDTYPDVPVEVEVDHLKQIAPVLKAGADVILLDNFTPAKIRKAQKLIQGKALTEASGGITLDNLADYSGLGLDFISTGALVHQSTWVDIGLDWET
jgi:nicotinate-nucleotide pyrophosphorylase (carboxylating)